MKIELSTEQILKLTRSNNAIQAYVENPIPSANNDVVVKSYLGELDEIIGEILDQVCPK